MCYQDANDKAIFSDTVIILGLPIEFILLKHVVGLSFALLNAVSFSLTAHFLKKQRRDSGVLGFLAGWAPMLQRG